MSIAGHICKYIQSELVDSSIAVTPEVPFEKLGLDSFSIISIVLFIERNFGVSLPDKELTKENLYNADTLATCVEKYQTK
jgi:acyl carrier protein